MMKNINIKNLLFVVVLLIMQLNSKAQYILKSADHKFNLYQFEQASTLYTKAFEKKKTIYAAQQLGATYQLMRDFDQAEKWYGIANAMDGVKPAEVLAYAKSLQQNGKYNEAKAQFLKYQNLAGAAASSLVDQWLIACDSAAKWMRNPSTTTITNEKQFNSSQSDWAAVAVGDAVVFSSDRNDFKVNDLKKPFLKFDGTILPNKNKYAWTGNQYVHLFQKNKQQDSISAFPLSLQTAYHVAKASFSADGNEVFYTVTRVLDKVVGKDNQPTTFNNEIYSSKKENGQWTAPIAFRYNNQLQWSVGDPFLSGDGQLLFFVANKPGGKGGTDIYYCTRNTDGTWADAVNLVAVNTAGNERTPVLYEKQFYYSTDAGVGMGGLDIFEGKWNNGDVNAIKNLGYPTNSPHDDFAYQPTGKLSGYFSSNRVGGLGSDDIYSYLNKEVVIVKPTFALEGTVYHQERKTVLANAEVSLYKNQQVVAKVLTDANGKFKFNLAEQASYSVNAGKAGFMRSATETLTTNGLKQSTIINKELFLNEIVIGKAIKLDNIFYDFNQAAIRPDAAIELDKLVTVLIENPNISIELGSHTDSRGNDAYNLKLSQARAAAAVAYIINKGIAKERIVAKGYGETRLINECKNGVNCADDEHQLNRRTEFKVIKQ